ncbi:MAG TPA: hypothetical protein VGR38_01610, partial [Candidatus Polarisedimenticolia bacterium]|nr:hypothetical protein [Candidatus Polarisedimenticolia bacterium]
KNETEAPLDTLFLEAPGLPGNPAVSGSERWRVASVVDAKGNKAALTWKAEEEAYSLHQSSPLGAGIKTTFQLEYERSLTPADRTAGYLSFPDRDAGTWYLKLRAYRAGSLGSDDFKDISVTLTPPQGWTVASSGSAGGGKGASAGGKTTLTAKTVRNFALALGEGMRPTRGAAGTIPVVVYSSSGQESWSKQVLAETSEAIGYYLAFLGAYPPSQVIVLPAEAGEPSGSSSTQVIYVPTGVSEAVLRDAISLQTARLVWGWSVGDPSDTTPFVANGLAIWCQQNYLAKKSNLDLHAQYLKAGINDTYLVGVLRGYDTTLLRTRAERAKIQWDFDRIVARAKSAAVMHMLGGILGEDKLQEVARGILRTSKQAILTDRDFQKLAQAATTARLEGFFDQWLRRKDSLDYYLSHVRVSKGDAGFEVHADVWKTGSASMPVEIIAEDVAGARVRALFPADRASGEMAIPLKAAPARVLLDPVQRLPLITRVGPGGRLDLAESLMVEGKLLRADEQIDRLLSDDPQDSRGLFMKGRILKERGDWAGALAIWSKVTTLPGPPDDAGKVWSQLWTARLYDLQGKRAAATALYGAVSKLPDVRGSSRVAATGIQAPFTDSWPPSLP